MKKKTSSAVHLPVLPNSIAILTHLGIQDTKNMADNLPHRNKYLNIRYATATQENYIKKSYF